MSQTNINANYHFLNGRIRYERSFDDKEIISTGDYSSGKPHYRYPMKDGKFHGECLSWHENGSISCREFFLEGKRIGLNRSWHSNGIKMSEGFWEKDLRKGKHRQWYDNGNIHTEEIFVKGLLDGMMREWYSNGVLKVETYYNNGFKHGVNREWHENGILKKHSEFFWERRVGDEKQWYSDGSRKSVVPYTQGLINGVKRTWHDNGNLMCQGSYVFGQRHGREKKWDLNGRLESEQIYVQGSLLEGDINDLIKSGRLTAQHILKMRNVAVRRLCLEELGYGRFLAQLEHEVLDKDGEQELVRIDWNRREDPIYLVKVKCPSTGAFYTLRVPPTSKTVKEAVAWTFGIKEKKYVLDQEA